jgi:hypothetical protein
MYATDPYQEPDHIATGSESLAEFARNAGMDNPEHCWLLDPRDVWVRNPFYKGPPAPHPEDFPMTEEETVQEVCPLDRIDFEKRVVENGTAEEDIPF